MAFIYNSQAELQQSIDQRLLVQLTNDDDTLDDTDFTNIDADVLERFENFAAAEIDNLIRDLYVVTTPLTGASITLDIKEIDANLVLAKLWLRRNKSDAGAVALAQASRNRLIQIGVGLEKRNNRVVSKTGLE